MNESEGLRCPRCGDGRLEPMGAAERCNLCAYEVWPLVRASEVKEGCTVGWCRVAGA